MHHELIMGLLLVRSAMRPPHDPRPEEVPIDSIDFAALRALSGRAPVEVPEAVEPEEDLRRAA